MQVVTHEPSSMVVFAHRFSIRRLEHTIDRTIVNPVSEWDRPAGVANAMHSFEVHLIAHVRINRDHSVAVDECSHGSPETKV